MIKYAAALLLVFSLSVNLAADEKEPPDDERLSGTLRPGQIGAAWSGLAPPGMGETIGTLTPEQIEAAWEGLASYKTLPAADPEGKSPEELKKLNDEIGLKNDQKALMAVEWAVIGAVSDPEVKPKVAARLARLAADPDVSYEAKVFICAMLFRIGTPAEVPAAAALLNDPKTADAARLFLERVDSEEAAAALRSALDRPAGKRELIGVMNSLSIKEDAASVGKMIELTKNPDASVAAAAWRALSNIANDETADFLIGVLQSADKADTPSESAAVRIALGLQLSGKTAKAETLFSLLANDCRTKASRMAGANWFYAKLDPAGQKAILLEWITSDDAAKLNVAAREMEKLDDAELEHFVQSQNVSEKIRVLLIEILARRQGEKMLPMMLSYLKTTEPEKVRMAAQFLTKFSGERTVSAMIDALDSENEEVRSIISAAISDMPPGDVSEPLLRTLMDKPNLRGAVIPILSKLNIRLAIEPLTELALNPDPKIYEAALEGLRGICGPVKADLERMFNLYLECRNDKQRDAVARAVASIAEKNQNAADRAAVLIALADEKKNTSDEYQMAVLPLLGRLGTEAVFARIDAARKSSNPALAGAAIRALCNWPNAEHSADLWEIAEKSDSPIFRNQALRAYIRVVTLPNDRPAEETLEMLKKSMILAENTATRDFILTRLATVRTLEAVQWAAEYLDRPELAEAAARTIVELAHHRFLRQPNKDFFEPILLKVEATSKESATVQKAEKARLGM